MKIGAHAPLYAVSAGKIVLAELEPGGLKEYLAHVKSAQAHATDDSFKGAPKAGGSRNPSFWNCVFARSFR
jgi:DNA-binding IclR family transcriptional regulator